MTAPHLLVANPTAQSGKNAARIVRARELLHGAGLAHDFLATAPAGGTVALVRDALLQKPYRAVISMGGDGTFAEVAKGLLASGRAREVALGMLPTGTANDQGKSFGLESAEAAMPFNVGVLVAGLEAELDAGRIRALAQDGSVQREDFFFDSAGWGISPRVLHLRNEDREAIARIPVVREVYRDQLVYAGAFLRTFLASYIETDKFDAELEADGQRVVYRGLTDLVVKATKVYGGLWVFDPASRPDDGLFEVVPFLGKRDWISKALVHADPTGTVHDALAHVGITESPGLRAARIGLAFTPRSPHVPLAAQIDGEEFPATARAEIEVLPRALRLVVPAEYATR